MKNFIVLASFITIGFSTLAQTEEELKSEQAPLKSEISKLQGEVDAIQAKIDALPGWKYGAFGTVGVSLSSFDNWFAQGSPNVSTGNIGITVNGFANLKEEKFFWRIALNVNLGGVKFDDKDDPTDDDSFQSGSDVFNISSLYGRNITKNIAASGLMEYRTTLLNNFNDPGYLDVGLGATWTPLDNLVVVVHPLNYNFVFAENDAVFESSLGAKILVDYTRKIGAINFKSNVSAFQSYKSSDLSNFTWVNSFGYTLWKKIGVGFEFGLRGNKQEALNFGLENYDVMSMDPAPTFENLDNQLQTYYLLGLNYSI
jgi:hypothetical protein